MRMRLLQPGRLVALNGPTPEGTPASRPKRCGEGEGSNPGVGTLVLTPRPESDLSNAGPDPSDQT